MQYEMIYLQEKKVSGIKARTSNNDPQMSATIGGLWQSFYEKGIYHSILNKADDKSIGLYTTYENADAGQYDVVVCCAVKEHVKDSTELVQLIIPEGRYAKFVVKGHMVKACIDFWTDIPTFGLNRNFTYDFEEYQSGGDMDNAEIHMYIGVSEE